MVYLSERNVVYFMSGNIGPKQGFFARIGARMRKAGKYSSSEYPTGLGLGKVQRSSSSVSSQFKSAIITDAKRRHKAGAASQSVTVGGGAGRRRIFSGINEATLSKAMTIIAFAAVAIIGLVIILISVSSGGQQVHVQQPSTGEQLGEPVADDSGAIVVEDTGATVTVTIGGAVRLQDEVLQAAKTASGYDFNNYLSELSSIMNSDISMVGIVGTVDPGTPVSGYPLANYPSQLVTALQNIGVNTAATANGNASVFGYGGLTSTISSLADNGITPIGTYASPEAFGSAYVKRINSVCVGIGSYNCPTAGDLAALTTAQGAAGFTPEQQGYAVKQFDIAAASAAIIADVNAMRAAGAQFIVIYLNWGYSGQTAPSAEMRSLAQDLIDNGVDVTVGVGPDFVQKVTKKTSAATGKDCYVFYSLGNLFSDVDSGASQSTSQSLVVSFTLERAAGSDVVTLKSANYHPVYCNRDSTYTYENTYLKYRVVPAARYVDADSLPEVFSTNDQWARCKTTFTNLRNLVGDKMVLGSVDRVSSSQQGATEADGISTSV